MNTVDGMMLYHRTDNADAIMRDGFRDGEGSYLTMNTYKGVWLSDSPLDANEGVSGDTVIEVNASEFDLSDWEWLEEGKPYREWLIPARFVNQMPRRIRRDRH